MAFGGALRGPDLARTSFTDLSLRLCLQSTHPPQTTQPRNTNESILSDSSKTAIAKWLDDRANEMVFALSAAAKGEDLQSKKCGKLAIVS